MRPESDKMSTRQRPLQNLPVFVGFEIDSGQIPNPNPINEWRCSEAICGQNPASSNGQNLSESVFIAHLMSCNVAQDDQYLTKVLNVLAGFK